MPKAPPLWYFGKALSQAECAKAVSAGPHGTFCVRADPSGDTAFLMIHDHEVSTSGKVKSEVEELPITLIKAGKFVFRGKPHKSIDEIVVNHMGPKNGFAGKSGRKVWCVEPADRPGKKKPTKKEIPEWFFGSKISPLECAKAIRAGESGTYCVRNDPDGDTAFLMIHDKGAGKDGKTESKIVEYKITEIKERKYMFKGRQHKNVDEIVDNLGALSNAITAKSGRKVYCKEAAARPGAAAAGKKTKKKKGKSTGKKKGKVTATAAAAAAEEANESEEEDNTIQTDAVDAEEGVAFEEIPDEPEEYESDDGGGDAAASAEEEEEAGGFSDDE